MQDHWNVSSKFAMNLGIRSEYDGAFSYKYGKFTNAWASHLTSVPKLTDSQRSAQQYLNPGAN